MLLKVYYLWVRRFHNLIHSFLFLFFSLILIFYLDSNFYTYQEVTIVFPKCLQTWAFFQLSLSSLSKVSEVVLAFNSLYAIASHLGIIIEFPFLQHSSCTSFVIHIFHFISPFCFTLILNAPVLWSHYSFTMSSLFHKSWKVCPLVYYVSTFCMFLDFFSTLILKIYSFILGNNYCQCLPFLLMK